MNFFPRTTFNFFHEGEEATNTPTPWFDSPRTRLTIVLLVKRPTPRYWHC